MNKANVIRDYHKLSAAGYYILGFELDGYIYAVKQKRIYSKYLKPDRESTKNGGADILRLTLTKKQKKILVKKLLPIATIEEMENAKNRGEWFEKLIYAIYKQDYRKDTTRFDKRGDIEINGEQVQIKFERATVANERTIKKIKRERMEKIRSFYRKIKFSTVKSFQRLKVFNSFNIAIVESFQQFQHSYC